MNIRFMGWSSATRMRARHCGSGVCTGVRAASSPSSRAVSKRAVNKKVLPCPGALSTRMSPPMSSDNRLQMASPRPVPLWRRDSEPSACTNRSKMCSRCLSRMPGPESVTENSSITDSGVASTARTARDTRPASVNFSALSSRFTSTWRSRMGSPTRPSGTSSGTRKAKPRPFSSARCTNMVCRVDRRLRRRNTWLSSSTMPASILEKSRMSLMSASSDSAEFCAASRYSRCSSSSGVSSARSSMPSTPFMGVRISWLMEAKNSLLALSAASAASLATRSSRSMRRVSVTSRTYSATMATCPAALRTGNTVMDRKVRRSGLYSSMTFWRPVSNTSAIWQASHDFSPRK